VRAVVYETNSAGDRLKEISLHTEEADFWIDVQTDKSFQTILGFGGAFTESTAHLLQHMSAEKRAEVVEAYFGTEGGRYNLCRTHINSCDFSLNSYAYVDDWDSTLSTFSVDEDRNDIIPLIKEAQNVSENGFRLIASPWSAPPWMKDNGHWFGGKLLPEYYSVWAKYFMAYEAEYRGEGIDIWAYTVENEPLGNGENWESMHFSPEETGDFVVNHLAPEMKKVGSKAKILVYDQNRGPELEEWADVLLNDTAVHKEIYGAAIHWYNSTYDWFPTSLQYTHEQAPDRHIINTEACVDSEIPHWKDDAWYWKKEATDWGYDWALEENKHRHPEYVPVYRYARDIIGCLNNWVEAWVDWNMVLDKQGGPNHASNWCVAPILVDTTSDEIYYTPLYETMLHFSKFIQEGAIRLGTNSGTDDLLYTACRNPDGELVLVVLHTGKEVKNIGVRYAESELSFPISPQSIQTIVISN
jgi:glucosylceramidase